jgi:hypothetical protein
MKVFHNAEVWAVRTSSEADCYFDSRGKVSARKEFRLTFVERVRVLFNWLTGGK